LSADRCLLDLGDHRVFAARAHEIPRTLREIGRLREETFRDVGEGTGRPLDLDQFDDHYWHLFVWNVPRARVAGAYRLGATDELDAETHPHALYTHTLFRFDGRLVRAIGPALEMGRSFVQRDFQRDFTTLFLLWKGIGRFVCERPRYRMLFGPVSISAEYTPASRNALVDALSADDYRSPLSPLVQPRRPPAMRSVSGPTACGIDDTDRLVRSLEPDGKGMPILLRQYLRLNARILGFSVDPDFGGVLDALIVVDLVRVDLPILQRYMGREAAVAFCRHHADRVAPEA
jgi:putative hemolysin